MDEFQEIRDLIDKIDRELATILIKRIKLVRSLHNEKIEKNKIIIDIQREYNILDNVTSKIQDDELKILVKNIYIKLLQELKSISYIKNKNVIDLFNSLLATKKLLIAGPCSVETEEQINSIAEFLSKQNVKFIRAGIFKARTNPESFQGLGEKGLEIFYNAAHKNSLFTVSEFLDIEQAKSYFEYFDVIIVGSRNMTNFEFLRKLGKLTSNNQKPIIFKRGFASTVDEFLSAADYIINEGNPNVVLCLRGIRTFEQTSSYFRFTPDLHSLLEIRDKSDLPVIFDPSHSAGNREIVEPLSKMAIDLKFDGLMIEIHNKPEEAWSDAQQAIDFNTLTNISKYMKINEY